MYYYYFLVPPFLQVWWLNVFNRNRVSTGGMNVMNKLARYYNFVQKFSQKKNWNINQPSHISELSCHPCSTCSELNISSIDYDGFFIFFPKRMFRSLLAFASTRHDIFKRVSNRRKTRFKYIIM